jgi:hypothetical protein
MTWLDWFASRHTWLVHLPWAAALMLVVPVVAAQRGGRGNRPWWTTCRYLAWTGLAAAVLTAASGLGSAFGRGLLEPALGGFPAPPGLARLVQFHGIAAGACVLLGALCLRSLYRKRQDHQGIGLQALALVLAWAVAACAAVVTGRSLVGRTPASACLLGTGGAQGMQVPPLR